jgi:hypothetical protein
VQNAQLFGTLPTLSALSMLSSLILSGNYLNGTLDASIAALTALTHL